LVKIGRVVRKIMTADKRTHRQTDTLITILRSPIGGGVNCIITERFQTVVERCACVGVRLE